MSKNVTYSEETQVNKHYITVMILFDKKTHTTKNTTHALNAFDATLLCKNFSQGSSHTTTGHKDEIQFK